MLGDVGVIFQYPTLTLELLNVLGYVMKEPESGEPQVALPQVPWEYSTLVVTPAFMSIVGLHVQVPPSPRHSATREAGQGGKEELQG